MSVTTADASKRAIGKRAIREKLAQKLLDLPELPHEAESALSLLLQIVREGEHLETLELWVSVDYLLAKAVDQPELQPPVETLKALINQLDHIVGQQYDETGSGASYRAVTNAIEHARDLATQIDKWADPSGEPREK
jgi:hypothetical protein